jgi:hypothetical protein
MAEIGSIESELDDYEFHVRNMQGVGPVYSPLLLPPAEVPKGISSLSSIGSIDKEILTPQHRPTLSEPQHVMYELLALHRRDEELISEEVQLRKEGIDASLKKIDQIELEREEALQKEAEAAKSRSTWSTLSQISEYITGVGAVGLGFAIGGLPGWCIGGAGLIGVGNRVAHDTHLLQTTVAWYEKSEELQKKLTREIEMGVFLLQTGLSLAGGVSGWQMGSFTAIHPDSGVEVMRQVSSAVTTASGVATASAQMGKEIYNKRISDYNAQVKELDLYKTSENHQMAEQTKLISKTIESDNAKIDQLRRAVRNFEVSLD